MSSKNQDTKNIIILLLLVMIIFAVIFGLRLKKEEPVTLEDMQKDAIEGKETEDNYVFNGFVFTYSDGIWYTLLQINEKEYNLPLRYDPKKTLNISIPKEIPYIVLEAKEIFLSVDNSLTSVAVLAPIELARILGTRYEIFNIPTKGAVTFDNNNNGSIIKTCDDAGNGTIIMVFQHGNSTNVRLEGECVLVEGTDDWELIRAADRIVYQLLKII